MAAGANAVLVLALPVMLKARIVSALVIVFVAIQALLTVAKSALIGMACFYVVRDHLSPGRCGMTTGLYDQFVAFTAVTALVTFLELTLGSAFLYAIGLMDVIHEAVGTLCPGHRHQHRFADADELNKLI